MLRFLRDLYFTNNFYLGVTIVVIVFIIGGVLPVLFPVGLALFFLFFGWLCIEIYFLFVQGGKILGERISPDKLSNGDENELFIQLHNLYRVPAHLDIIDEIPHQFQRRDLQWQTDIDPGEEQTLLYKLRPTKRGEYDFGAVNIFCSIFLRLVQRRFRYDNGKILPVYPSFLQMKKYELAAFSNFLEERGIKKQRRIGNTFEFEQIKEYVQGDDPRTINWKATARRNTLMVNQYQEEKSQPVYAIVDKGRLMKMPFDGLSLLDYAINASLVILNIALKKEDKAGLITFSNKMSTALMAEKKAGQMFKIQEALYNQLTLYKETNFELLSLFVNRRIKRRSLLLLFTNFESIHALDRQLPYFRSLAKRHVIVVIFFKNTAIKELLSKDPETIEEIYQQTVAEKFSFEKELMARKLNKNKVYTILTTPQDLTIDTINKYLELKARGVV
jgi:uncharacterized protein (DUF58 family)